MIEYPPLPVGLLETLNTNRGGFNELIGLTFVAASYNEVVARVEVGAQLLQPYGLVHGGVYSSMVETLASVGAALCALADGRTAVGLENNTSFLRAVRHGTLVGRATPLHRGRRTHVWQVRIHDDTGREAAIGRVRMLCLEKGSTAAGEPVAMQ